MFMPKKFSEEVIVFKEYDVSNIFNAASGVMNGDLRVIKEEKRLARFRINVAIFLGEVALFFLSLAFIVFPKHPAVCPFLSSKPPASNPFIRKDLVEAAVSPLNNGIQKSGELKVSTPLYQPISVPNKRSLDTRARQADTDMDELIKETVRK